MIKCPICGADNPTGQGHCRHCRAALLKACPRCKSMNKPVARFCANCGWQLTGAFLHTTKSLCARCGRPVDQGIPRCPSCNAELSWPEG